jgi:hypothetical protein
MKLEHDLTCTSVERFTDNRIDGAFTARSQIEQRLELLGLVRPQPKMENSVVQWLYGLSFLASFLPLIDCGALWISSPNSFDKLANEICDFLTSFDVTGRKLFPFFRS